MHVFARTTFRPHILTKTPPVPLLSSLPLRWPPTLTTKLPRALFPRPVPLHPPRHSRSIHIVTPPRLPSKTPRQHQYQHFQSRTSSFYSLWKNSPHFRLLIFATSAGLLTVYVYNIEEVPVSGRRRFNIISPALEVRLGKSIYQSTMEEFGPRILPKNHPTSMMVWGVMQRLIKVSGKYLLDSFPFLFLSFNIFLSLEGADELRVNFGRDGGSELGSLCYCR